MSLDHIRYAKSLPIKLPPEWGEFKARCRRPSSKEAMAFSQAQMDAYAELPEEVLVDQTAEVKVTKEVMGQRKRQMELIAETQAVEYEYLLGLLVSLDGALRGSQDFDRVLADIRSDALLDDLLAGIRTAIADAEGGKGQLPLQSAEQSSLPPEDLKDVGPPTE